MAQDFWRDVGPGLLSTAGGFFQQKEAEKEGEKRLKALQGPLYDRYMGAAGQALTLAGGMDPKAHAAERYGAAMDIANPSFDAEEQKIMRQLAARGQLGLASHGAVPGTKPTPGVAMNPQLAAFYAGKAGAQQKAAYDSLNEGEAYLDRLLGRSRSMEQAARPSDVRQAQFKQPKAPSIGSQLLTGLMKDPSMVMKGVGMLGDLGSKLLGGSSDSWGGWTFELPEVNFDLNLGSNWMDGYDLFSGSDWWY